MQRGGSGGVVALQGGGPFERNDDLDRQLLGGAGIDRVVMLPTADAFEQPATLRDGRPVTIRLMRPDDKQRLIDAFAKLDRQSVYTRFFAFRKELPQGPLERIDRIEAGQGFTAMPLAPA